MSLYASPAALNADAYKSGHFKMYPQGTSQLYFNMTPRSDKHFKTPLEKDGVIVFGIQRFCEDYLVKHWNETFFNRPKKEVVDELTMVMNGVLGAGTVPRQHWEDLHDLGYLPIRVDAVPEGTLLPVQVPMLSFTNTDKNFAWVAGYLEDAFSNELWKAVTIATIAFHYRRLFEKYAEETCDNNLHVPYQGHDFSLRGESGMNDGSLNNVAHLSSFKGTDNFAAVYTAYRVYGEGMEISEFGASIPATEHSVMTANIISNIHKMFGEKADENSFEQRHEGERETFRQFLTELYPSGLVSIVSDTFNYWNTIGNISHELRDFILQRDSKLVFRPDSGDPFHVVCGYKSIHFDYAKDIILAEISKNPKYHGELNVQAVSLTEEHEAEKLMYLDKYIKSKGYELLVWDEDEGGCMTLNLNTKEKRFMTTEEIEGSLRTLHDRFPGQENEKGYKQLDPHVGLIYGDSITLETAQRILERMKGMGFASSNIVFGIGSYTYQYNTRDTFGFAVKATYLEGDKGGLMLSKDPVTDSGLKKSARGCVVPMVDSSGKIYAQDELTSQQFNEMIIDDETLYQCVFCEGVTFNSVNLADIRKKVDFFL